MTNDWTEITVKPTEAAKQLRKLTICTRKGERARSVFLSVRQEAPIADKPDHVFPILGSIKVTRQQAEKFIADSYSANLEARGAMVKLSWSEHCVFVGC